MENNIKRIYIQIAYDKNPGPCAWGAIIEERGKGVKLSGLKENSTNNEIILEGAIRVLETLREPSEIEIYTTSSYLVDAFNEGWIEKWKRRRWKTSYETKVQHKELWLKLDKLVQFHQVTFHKINNDVGDAMIDRCKVFAEQKLTQTLMGIPITLL